MQKRAVSVTLDRDNLAWLQARARVATWSVSKTLDRLIEEARKSGRGDAARSVVGTVALAPEDPGLLTADDAVRAVFARSLNRRPFRRVRPRTARHSGRARG
jgi:hypothetical protein